MSEEALRERIAGALGRFATGDLVENARRLLGALGYASNRTLEVPDSPEAFLRAHDGEARLNRERALFADWQSASLVFQLTDTEIAPQLRLFDRGPGLNKGAMNSCLFVTVGLCRDHYTRTELSTITREINKLFLMPVLVLFKHGQALTLAVIDRRVHKRHEDKDVLEKVTLIKDIAFAQPHRAHIEVLSDLSLAQLSHSHQITCFDELHKAWRATLDISELNKRFYRQVANWFFWAQEKVVFPKPPEVADEGAYRAQSVIRLITRLIFCWFLKEKDLIPEDLFSGDKMRKLLAGAPDLGSSEATIYYKAILQNLFFATLNQEMDARGFRTDTRSRGQAPDYMVFGLYRYRELFQRPDEALQLFARIPFVNGGLFDCLDKGDEAHRVDGFSDRPQNPLRVPDYLFFAGERDIDLNPTYGTQGKGYKVQGLVEILARYKFTIEENTPLDEEVALDPELLGKVFENLLAAYNPETGVTARKQTGSFYTPREVVDYMVDESLLAYLTGRLRRVGNGEPQPEEDDSLTERLRHLLAYNDEPHRFSEEEVARLIEAIDAVKVLDPACGSGAFPMGVLHKLVFVLGKLDPHNEGWKERQLANALKFPDSTIRAQALDDIEEAFERNELDYGRKLFLLQNCIYGVDIQPIAVQIAKLRCFISLIIDQRVDDTLKNRGIRPLPNLETRFVAANSLVPLPRTRQIALRTEAVRIKEAELTDARREHFDARTRRQKKNCEERDKTLRAELAGLLSVEGFSQDTTEMLANWDPYDQNASAGFFDREWMFGMGDGFDIVISNPPYVRQEQITDQKPSLRAHYECYTGTADLYVYFFERGLRELRPGGVLTFICANKYFRAGYGERLRRLLAEGCTLLQLIDFADAPVFTAIAYPSIIVVRKAPPQSNHVQVLQWTPGRQIEMFGSVFQMESSLIPQSTLTAQGWHLVSVQVSQLLDKTRAAGKPLGEYLAGQIYMGIKTGLNDAFVVDATTRDLLVAADEASADVIVPFIRGRHIRRWRVDPSDEYLIRIESSENKRHPWTGHSLERAESSFRRTYPAIYEHLEPFREALARRDDQGKYFWELRSCAYWALLEQPKIIYPDIYEHQSFAVDSAGFHCANTCYFLPTNKMWLCGLLNSRLIEWFYSHISSKVRGGYLRAFTDYVKQIPIPAVAGVEAVGVVVDEILEMKSVDPSADVSSLEGEIDELVYRLYGLTKDEVAIVEGG